MPGRQAAPGHAGRLRRRGPLIRVESGGMKQIRRYRRITPFAVLKCRHVEMHKHAKTQIHKPLLQIEERPSATRSYAMHFVLFRRGTVITAQHRSRRRLGSQPEELSSRRHLRCSNPEWKGSLSFLGIPAPGPHEPHCIRIFNFCTGIFAGAKTEYASTAFSRSGRFTVLPAANSSFCVAVYSGVDAIFVNTSAFVGTNPAG
jgi:hypothetical protein